MTPKEKAKVLVDSFKDRVNPYVGSGMLSNTHDDNAILWQSKECALIVCKECIREHSNDSEYKDQKIQDIMITYWQNVHKEIELL